MENKTKGRPIREFFEIEAQSLYQRYKSIEAILPSSKGKGSAHAAEEGRFVESLVREFLNRHLPNDLIAISGFILKPSTKTGEANYSRVETEYDSHSRQIDIIVYDKAKFPMFERFEEFGIVPPEGVIAIISVKKNLRIEHIEPEIKALKQSAELCFEKGIRPPYTGIFSFSSDFQDTPRNMSAIEKIYKAIFDNEPYESMLNELTVMDKFIIFKFRDKQENEEVTFVDINCKERMHVPLQRLLQSILGVYYNKSLNRVIERPGYTSFDKGTFNDADRFMQIKKKIEQ